MRMRNTTLVLPAAELQVLRALLAGTSAAAVPAIGPAAALLLYKQLQAMKVGDQGGQGGVPCMRTVPPPVLWSGCISDYHYMPAAAAAALQHSQP
jgi:hypothetical protein